jgi:hypothetical protein
LKSTYSILAIFELNVKAAEESGAAMEDIRLTTDCPVTNCVFFAAEMLAERAGWHISSI